MNTNVTKLFVLMLENRAFDHMLGFSGITGTDAQTGQPTKLNGLTGSESNSWKGVPYPVTQPADFTMPVDPGHEFLDVVQQLGGITATYPFGGAYPAIDNSGFVANYVDSNSPDEGKAPDNFGEIMKCYSPDQLPVLNALATNFAVCDNWFSSIPGPTWPNRFFLHAASSGGLDHSPTTEEILDWEGPHGFSFPNDSIFDALNNNSSLSFPWKIYRGASSPKVGSIPSVSALKGITYFDTTEFESFANDVNMPSYPWSYTFIEPNYGDVTDNTYSGG
jgi:phospholipase C